MRGTVRIQLDLYFWPFLCKAQHVLHKVYLHHKQRVQPLLILLQSLFSVPIAHLLKPAKLLHSFLLPLLHTSVHPCYLPREWKLYAVNLSLIKLSTTPLLQLCIGKFPEHSKALNVRATVQLWTSFIQPNGQKPQFVMLDRENTVTMISVTTIVRSRLLTVLFRDGSIGLTLLVIHSDIAVMM